jgi:hypothetical protein
VSACVRGDALGGCARTPVDPEQSVIAANERPITGDGQPLTPGSCLPVHVRTAPFDVILRNWILSLLLRPMLVLPVWARENSRKSVNMPAMMWAHMRANIRNF